MQPLLQTHAEQAYLTMILTSVFVASAQWWVQQANRPTAHQMGVRLSMMLAPGVVSLLGLQHWLAEEGTSF